MRLLSSGLFALVLIASPAVYGQIDYTLFMEDVEVEAGSAFSLPVKGTWQLPVTGFSLAMTFTPNPPIAGLAFTTNDTIVGELAPDFLNVNLNVQSGEVIVGMLFEATPPPFDGDSLPPVSFPLSVGRFVGSISEATVPQVVAFNFLNGLGTPPTDNVFVVEITTSVNPTLLNGGDLTILPAPPPPPPAPQFLRGDANFDGAIDIGDILFHLNYAFAGGATPVCQDAADANDDALSDITDAVYLVCYLFVMGDPPPAPFPNVGADPTFDFLDCEAGQP